MNANALSVINDALSGKTLQDAQAEAIRNGWSIRVMEQDGESLISTCDFRMDRVNVTVNGGVVTSANSIG